METASEAGTPELAEKLLRHFVETDSCPKSCFAATLYTCYKLIRPDVVMELAWRNNLTEFAMPYMVQSFRQFSDRLSDVEEKIRQQEALSAEAKEQEKKEQEAANQQAAAKMFGDQPLMLTSAAGMGTGPGAYGAQGFGSAG